MRVATQMITGVGKFAGFVREGIDGASFELGASSVMAPTDALGKQRVRERPTGAG